MPTAALEKVWVAGYRVNSQKKDQNHSKGVGGRHPGQTMGVLSSFNIALPAFNSDSWEEISIQIRIRKAQLELREKLKRKEVIISEI